MMPQYSPIRLAVLLLALSAGLAAQQMRAPVPQDGDWQIAGRIISAADGRPLVGANVIVASPIDPENVQQALTGNDGRFRFNGLTAGKYVLQAQHRGFVSQVYQQHGGFSTAIAVGPGLELPDVLFRLQPEGIISGTVVDETGDPVRDAQVVLLHQFLLNGQWETGMGNSVQTDDQGHYHFSRLLPGRYFVAVNTQPWYATSPMTWVESAGKLPATPADSALDVAYPVTYYQEATNFDDATPIDLQAGERTTADISLTAVPAQHIRLHIGDTSVSGFGATLSGEVSQGSTISVPTQFQKVAPGIFESTGVPPGSYEMQLFYPRRPGEQDVDKEIKVDAGKNEEIDLSEPTVSASVTGMARFVPATKVPEYLRVVLIRKHSQQAFRANISPRGEFAFEPPVAPGDYEVVSSSAQGFYIARLTATGASVAGRSLKITGSDPVVLQVVMSRGVAQVKGTAVRGGKPVSGALVVLVPRDPVNNQPLFRADQSDSDGTFTLPSIVPGKYTLVAVDNGWSLEWRNPAALKPYLSRGQLLEIAPEGRYNIKPEVQDF